MKRLSIYSSLFLLAFVAAFSLSMTMGGSVQAGSGNCKSYCAYELVCSTDTGPYCTNPAYPYYMYEMNPYCVGFPQLFCLEDINPPPIGCCSSCGP